MVYVTFLTVLFVALFAFAARVSAPWFKYSLFLVSLLGLIWVAFVFVNFFTSWREQSEKLIAGDTEVIIPNPNIVTFEERPAAASEEGFDAGYEPGIISDDNSRTIIHNLFADEMLQKKIVQGARLGDNAYFVEVLEFNFLGNVKNVQYYYVDLQKKSRTEISGLRELPKDSMIRIYPAEAGRFFVAVQYERLNFTERFDFEKGWSTYRWCSLYVLSPASPGGVELLKLSVKAGLIGGIQKQDSGFLIQTLDNRNRDQVVKRAWRLDVREGAI